MKKLLIVIAVFFVSSLKPVDVGGDIKSAADTLIDGIKTAAQKAAAEAQTIAENAPDDIKEAVENAAHMAQLAEQKIIEGIKTATPDVLNEIKKIIKGGVNIFTQPIQHSYDTYKFWNTPDGYLHHGTESHTVTEWAASLISPPLGLRGLLEKPLTANALKVSNDSHDIVYVTSSAGDGTQFAINSGDNPPVGVTDTAYWSCQQPFGYDTPCVNTSKGGSLSNNECHRATACEGAASYVEQTLEGPAFGPVAGSSLSGSCYIAGTLGFGTGGICGAATHGPLLHVYNDVLSSPKGNDSLNELGNNTLAGGYVTLDTIVNNSGVEYDIAITSAPLATINPGTGNYAAGTIAASLADGSLSLMDDVYTLSNEVQDVVPLQIGSTTHYVSFLKNLSKSPFSSLYVANKQEPANGKLNVLKHMQAGPLRIVTPETANANMTQDSWSPETIILIPRGLSEKACYPWILIGRDVNATPLTFHAMSYVVKEIGGNSCGSSCSQCCSEDDKEKTGCTPVYGAITVDSVTDGGDIFASSAGVTTKKDAKGRLKLTIDEGKSTGGSVGVASKLEILPDYWVPGGTDFK